MDRLRQELRYAVRSLWKSPGFSIVAILTLAVGIAAVTAMFTVVDGVLLKPLRYPDADRIVSIVNRYPDRSAPNLSGGDEADIALERGAFDVVAYYHGGEIGVQLGDRAEFVGVSLVHPDFFRVFAASPLAGRLFNADDAGRSVVVSAGFARRNFGAVPAALTRPVFIESHSYDIVGVMPAGMGFPAKTEVWAAEPLLPDNRNRTGHGYRAVARLGANVSVAAANDRLSALAARLAAAYPVSNEGKTFVAIPLQDTLVSQVRTTLFVLMGAVALVLLIACANAANLMLARASARESEMAIRAALGASRHQIIGQLLVESLVLGAIACGLGLLLADAGIHALLQAGASYVPLPRIDNVHIDWRVLAFSIVTCLLTTVAFGLAPAVHASRVRINDAMSHGGVRGAVGGRAARMRNALVVAQIALSFTLAIDAGLLLRSFVSLAEASLGFERSGVLVMYAHAPAKRAIFDQSGLESYLRIGRSFDDLLARLRQVPEVVAAGAVMGLPTGQYGSNGVFAVEGRHTFGGDFRRLPSAGFRLASAGYFDTLNIPLVRGRDFGDGDLYDRPFVAIVSQSLARQVFGDDDPVGHRIMCGFDQPSKWMTIVGVVGDVRQASPASPPGPELYMPLRQHPYMANEVQVVMRSRVRPESLIGTVQQIVKAGSPDVATKFTTLDASVDDSIAAPRFRAALASTFASLALLLALAGIYAVMSYLTARRMAEFGLRVALGAGAGDVVRLVLGQAGRLAVIGIAVGSAMALATGRIVANLLIGVTTTDLPTYISVLLVAMPLVIAAASVPAIRAARADPMLALKGE